MTSGANASSPASTTGAALAIGPDGKIVAVGTTLLSGASSTVFAIARLNPDGTLDSSFDGNGLATVSLSTSGSSGSSDTADAVTIQADDKIVIVGQAYLLTSGSSNPNGVPTDAAVVRLNADGTLDSSFNGTGMLTFTYNVGGSSVNSARAVVLEGTQIVVAGTSMQLSGPTYALHTSDLTVTRLNSDGTFDDTFNGDGRVLLSLNQGGTAYNTEDQDAPGALLVMPDGSLLVGGNASAQSGASDGLLMNLTSTGALNPSYGSNGVALLPTSVRSRLFLQSDGKVVFVTSYGVARTTAPAPAVAGTTIITTGTGTKAKASSVTITFNTAIDPVQAVDIKVYLGRSTKGGRLIAIRKKGGITYDAATQTLTINFARKTMVNKGFEVRFKGGAIVGVDGQVLFKGAVIPIVIAPSTA